MAVGLYRRGTSSSPSSISFITMGKDYRWMYFPPVKTMQDILTQEDNFCYMEQVFSIFGWQNSWGFESFILPASFYEICTIRIIYSTVQSVGFYWNLRKKLLVSIGDILLAQTTAYKWSGSRVQYVPLKVEVLWIFRHFINWEIFFVHQSCWKELCGVS